MNNNEGPKRKVISQEVLAATFLQALTERVWLSLYFGRPTVALSSRSGNPFCGDVSFVKFGHDGTEAPVVGEAEIPTRSDLHATGYWPYDCSPAKVTIVRPDRGPNRFIQIDIISADLVGRLFELIPEILRLNAPPANYCLTTSNARLELQNLTRLFKRRSDSQQPDLNVYGQFHGYYLLEHPDESSRRAQSIKFLVESGFGATKPELIAAGRILTGRYLINSASSEPDAN